MEESRIAESGKFWRQWEKPTHARAGKEANLDRCYQARVVVLSTRCFAQLVHLPRCSLLMNVNNTRRVCAYEGSRHCFITGEWRCRSVNPRRCNTAVVSNVSGAVV